MKKPYLKVALSEELIVTVIFLLCVIGLAFYTLGWPYKPKLMPLGISILAAVLLAGRIVVVARKKEEGIGRIPWKVTASFIAFGVAIPIAWLVGLVPAVGLLGASLSFIYGERRWWSILLVGIGSSLVMYLIFGQLFRLPMTL